MTTFSSLGISDALIKALSDNNILIPSEIQKKAIPFLLKEGKDMVAQAQTGTGKTAAFGLPLLQKVDPSKPYVQALILCPTRELGQQIAKQLFRFTKHMPKIFVEAVYGGAFIGDQIKALLRPTHIVVATPGRLVDLLERKAVDLSHVKTIVLDEADEMLSMGFKKELDQILTKTAGQRNTWLFSATMPKEIQNIINTYMSSDAFNIRVEKDNTINKNITHNYILCEEKEKTNLLVNFFKKAGYDRAIVFCKTKAVAQKLSQQLHARNFLAEALHGDLLQKERDKVMRAFKGNKLQILVATDIAARGLDVQDLPLVIHYQMPDQIDFYTHRSGRTARAGNKGLSLCLITEKEMEKVTAIEKDLKIAIKQVPAV